jgi:hypothetical protein
MPWWDILKDRPEQQTTIRKSDLLHRYAVCLLRKIRSVLAPNGSSSNAPAIIVGGSGTAEREPEYEVGYGPDPVVKSVKVSPGENWKDKFTEPLPPATKASRSVFRPEYVMPLILTVAAAFTPPV